MKLTETQQKLSAYILEHFGCVPREDEIKDLQNIMNEEKQAKNK